MATVEGYLEISGGTFSKWKKVFARLYDGKIICHKDAKHASKVGEEPLDIIPLNGTTFSEEPVVKKKINCFALRCPHVIYFWPVPDQVDSKKQLSDWLHGLEKDGRSRKQKENEAFHSFKKHHFNVPTWCHQCGAFLWGLGKQGYQCKACKFVAHDECIFKVPPNCGSATFATPLTQSPSGSEVNLLGSHSSNNIQVSQGGTIHDMTSASPSPSRTPSSSFDTNDNAKSRTPNHTLADDLEKKIAEAEARTRASQNTPQKQNPYFTGHSDEDDFEKKIAKAEARTRDLVIGESSSESSSVHTSTGSATSSRRSTLSSMPFNNEDYPEIPASSLKIGKKIGEGQFGKVYEATLHGAPVAVKILNQECGLHTENNQSWDSFIEAVKKEITIMRQITHPHVLLYIGVSSGPSGELMIVTEKMKTDLDHLLIRDGKQTDMTAIQKLKMARQVAMAMAHLHNSNPCFLHLDLKPANILVSDSGVVKVGDFGQTVKVKATEMKEVGAVGTPAYMAPELFEGGNVSPKCDTYSFGILLWEILYQERAFNFRSTIELMSAVCEQKRRPSTALPLEGRPMSKRLEELLHSCWDHEAEKRPDFPQIVEWLDEVIVEYSVKNLQARKFWQTFMSGTFTLVEQVPWDSFWTALVKDFPLPDGLEPSIAEICCKALLAPNPKSPNVDLENFGKVVDWFGPLSGKKHMARRIVETLQLPYFHGTIDKNEAYDKLRDTTAGSYLIRLSSTQAGKFAISRLRINSKHQREVCHDIIAYEPDQEMYYYQKRGFATLPELVENHRSTSGLIQGCTGSPFLHLFVDPKFNHYEGK